MLFNNGTKIKNYDLIVVGNSLAAVLSAGNAAEKGKSVALVTESELLFSEYSEALLGFVKGENPLFDLLKKLGAEPYDLGEEYHIPSGMAAKIALKYLRDRNVNILLKAVPIGLLKNADRVCGIAIATKFGAYVVKGSYIADFSDRKFYEATDEKNEEYLFAFQSGDVDFSGIKTPCPFSADLGDVYDITLHRDCRSDDTCLITFKTKESRAAQCIGKAVKIAELLKKNNPAFKNSSLLKFAIRPISLVQNLVSAENGLLSIKSGDILNSADYYGNLKKAIETVLSATDFNFTEPETLKMLYGEFDLASLYSGSELDEFLGVELPKINLPLNNIPTIKVDLFIAGLGTGGAAALRSALESGCSVVSAEAMPIPGGTRTLGMVSAFWHGYTGGFADKNRKDIYDYARLNLGENTPLSTSEAIYNIKVSEKCTFLYSTFVFGSVKDGENTVGALLATPDGVIKVEAKKSIDATGDGDLAALSGTKYMPNGDARDFVTQGYSIWGYEKVGTPFKDSLYKNDDDSISTEKYSEYLRGIFITQSAQSDLGFSPLITVRESRRIKGKYVLNMEDILRQRVFDDTVTVSLCQYDAHGVGSSPAYYTSLFNSMKSKDMPDVCTRIPLRCLLPKKDGGLMVISKAISATRDAGCLIRMNPDIQNVGYAAGLIAANAAKNSLDFEKAYTDEIKNILIEKEILPDFYNKASEPTAKTLLAGIEAGDKWAITTATAYKEYLPDFEAAYNGDDNLARVLAALGSDKAFYDLLSSFKSAVQKYENEKKGAETIKTYAVLLSRLAAENNGEKAELLPTLKKAIEVMDAGGDHINPERGIYQNSKVSNRTVPNFRAIIGLCMAAETVADPLLIASLMSLSKKRNINLNDGDEIHSVQLYLRIIAAAARCGDRNSQKELEKYLSSERLFFREFAAKELSDINSAQKDILPVPISDFWD